MLLNTRPTSPPRTATVKHQSATAARKKGVQAVEYRG
jgi:hypothetical protein